MRAPVMKVICRAAAAVAALAATDIARAQNCEAMTGAARTDCYIGRARILGQQSGNAAAAARVRADEEYLRAATGTMPEPKPRSAKATRKVRPH